MLEDIVRCPYCVQGSEFRPMLRGSSNKWYVCISCGHSAAPDDPYLKCPCARCQEMARLRRRNSEDATPHGIDLPRL